MIKMAKVKDKETILKATREKMLLTYRGVPINLSADFSKETLQARNNGQEIFKVIKSRDLQPRLPYLAKISFRIERQVKSFPDQKEKDMQVQEAQRAPNKIDAKRPTLRHIIIKMPRVKDKERILKAAGEKKRVTYRGVPIRL